LNPELTDIACAGLNDMELGEDNLVVQRASEGGVRMMSIIGLHNNMSLLGSFSINFTDIQPSCILLLLNLAGSIDELHRDYEGMRSVIQFCLFVCV
jgi:splicing factor U2AF subunit